MNLIQDRYIIRYDLNSLNAHYPKILVHGLNLDDDPIVEFIEEGTIALPSTDFFVVDFTFSGFGGEGFPDSVFTRTRFGAFFIRKAGAGSLDYLIDGNTILSAGVALIAFNVDGGGI